MANATLANTSLPACLEEPCAPCYIAARTSWIEFPYHIAEKPYTVSVIPYVTEFPDGSLSTSYSTANLDQTSTTGGNETGGLEILDAFTWVVSGLTLTYPTTYAGLHNFSGKATDHWASTAGEKCSPVNHTTSVALPPTVNRASLIVPFNTASHKGPGAVPTPVLKYLDSLDMVRKQFSHIPLTSCLPATPIAQPTLCTVATTRSSTTCFTQTTTYSNKHGAKTSTSVTCATETFTTEITKTNFRTDTSITGETIKRKTAGSLTLVTGAPVFASATALAAQDPPDSSDDSQDQPAPSPSGESPPAEDTPQEEPQISPSPVEEPQPDDTPQGEPSAEPDADANQQPPPADTPEPSAAIPGPTLNPDAGDTAGAQASPPAAPNPTPDSDSGSGSGARSGSGSGTSVGNAPVFAIDGQTLTAGGAATVGGNPVSQLPDQAGVVLGGSQTISLADGEATTINQGGQGALEVSRSGSAFVVDDQTLAPGQEMRAGGTTVSLGQSTGVLFVNGRPTTLAGPSVTIGGSVHTAAETGSSADGGLGDYIYSGVGGSSSTPTETSPDGGSASGSEGSTGVATATTAAGCRLQAWGLHALPLAGLAIIWAW